MYARVPAAGAWSPMIAVFDGASEMPDVKRMALFLDGTWNNISANTNVWRLKSLCDSSPEQLVYYSAGVGTHDKHLSGGMFGIGIDEEVIDAYEWLIENYQPGAQLFIFGFSRGAFTARHLRINDTHAYMQWLYREAFATLWVEGALLGDEQSQRTRS